MKKQILLLAFLCVSLSALGQTAILMPQPRIQFFNTSTGKPLGGGCVFAYAAGTSTQLPTYADSAATILNSNPVILDASGMAFIYLQAATSYKIVVKSQGGVNCASGTQQYVADSLLLPSVGNAAAGLNQQVQVNCSGIMCGYAGLAYNPVSGFLTVSGVHIQFGGILDGTFSGAPIFQGIPIYQGGASYTATATYSVPPQFNNGAAMLGNFTGNPTFTQGIRPFKIGNSPVFADFQAGADCGAKINAADASFAGASGEIWVGQSCGLAWTTPVVITANHTLRITQGGLYTTSGVVTLAGIASSLAGPPSSMDVNTVPAFQLQMATGANLSALVSVTGNFAVVQDVGLDGNKAGNLTAGPNLLFTSVLRGEISRVTSGNSNSHGVSLVNSAAPKIFKLMAYQNKGSGMACSGNLTGGGDVLVTGSEFENNGLNGLDLNDCPGAMVVNNDISTNGNLAGAGLGADLYIHGTAAVGANQNQILGNRLSNGFQDSMRIVGYNAGNSSLSNIIQGNMFQASANRTPTNTYSQIKLIDGGQDIVQENLLTPSGIGHVEFAGIDISETGAGRFVVSHINSNVGGAPASWTGTGGFYSDTTSQKASGTYNVNLLYNQIAPTISSGFGTTPTVPTNNGTASFSVNVGTGGTATAGIIAMPTAVNGWNCLVNNQTAAAANRASNTRQTASTATTVSVENQTTSTGAAVAWTASDILTLNCFAR